MANGDYVLARGGDDIFAKLGMRPTGGYTRDNGRTYIPVKIEDVTILNEEETKRFADGGNLEDLIAKIKSMNGVRIGRNVEISGQFVETGTYLEGYMNSGSFAGSAFWGKVNPLSRKPGRTTCITLCALNVTYEDPFFTERCNAKEQK